MATFSQSTIDKGSDIVQDLLCSTCEDKTLDKMADFYCESCVKLFCGECVNMHNKLFTKHAHFGRGHMKKWPVAKKVEDFLLKCDNHNEESLNMYCDEHSELCCTNCAFLKHRYIVSSFNYRKHNIINNAGFSNYFQSSLPEEVSTVIINRRMQF
ncbi:hypothetical protein DPMN_067731 [Dreissena polymorpha]|uniref:B box-type domain-containing protein n=1 Tax=Dreissena polymorpha TaxID=45954 RepID=A0A9D3Z189_DREPO|nr:hypothetical protein DPMN_067731 [Dreissena polymorpha]